MPIAPVAVAAVDPACGLERFGSASPIATGEEADAGELVATGELAAAGNGVELPVADGADAEDAPLAGAAVLAAPLLSLLLPPPQP